MHSESPTLGRIVESFFRDTLATQRNASPQTVASYRDTLKLFLVFVAEQKRKAPSSLKILDLDAESVLAFLNYIESDRKCSIATRNVRRTALRSFFKHVGYKDPASLGIVERVLLVPAKRGDRKPVDFLRPDEQAALLDAPDQGSIQGRRDYALLLFLVRTGARESEAIAIEVRHARLMLPRQVLLFGKGNKQRIVPLCEATAVAINQMLLDRDNTQQEEPLFCSRDGSKFSRHGVIHIVRRYAMTASATVSTLMQRSISPHLLRHTCAMNLLRAGVDLTTIQAWLGHVSVQTTHVYIEADIEMKRKTLELCPVTVSEVLPFKAPDSLLALLEAL
jgi:integrase/recombinase XerD